MHTPQEHYESSNMVFLKIGDVAFLNGNGKAWTILGSCVSICLFSKTKKFTAICHAQLPEKNQVDGQCYSNCPRHCKRGGTCLQDNKYVDKVVPYMVSVFAKQDIPVKNIQAIIVGGASVVEALSGEYAIGIKNIEASKRILGQFNIPVLREDTGSKSSRRIVVDNTHSHITVNHKNIIKF